MLKLQSVQKCALETYYKLDVLFIVSNVNRHRDKNM